ncbi:MULTISPECIES: aminotransferase class I/II-fold pyridoxal phosphate-dependent enzyme [unclassified Mycobacterium]|uniref:aminotransferase class I/II-fold pyridoxal phosphate-dependent enzyme n=1 Tax=unclassified Mycobacterium TaxID=2642494 RepID=UPI00274143D8|nr:MULTISPECIES: aminotransferase class I/II-fold pyridoxal phosphate-dependent enzyme [unclassified Mycobacterium]MDP7703634.1 aminotransferase class I/II-fold pyridoxal phosphate-dependent enzyme [Mycobacterium sp. TY815]MDP7722116.1 aminotransferase class I/II-fold pyridoxal phosphate-dependent enzyme [Mycobacterium sp. TY814]
MIDTKRDEAAMRDMASRLLAGRGNGASAGPLPRPAAPAPRSTRQQFADHPLVASACELNSRRRAIWELTGMPSPLFLERKGYNTAVIDGPAQQLTNFAGYNYLGLAHHPKVVRAVQDAVAQYGASASNSRITSGEIALYPRLEQRLAEIYDVEAAILATSGFLTNAGVLGYLLNDGDAAVCDSLIHASVVAGARWGGARVMTFRHNDPDSLRGILRASRDRFNRVLVVIEGLYSMDGDIGLLPQIASVAREFDCGVMVDEAHSIGVLGPHGHGVREHYGLPGDAVDIWMGSLSKALGSCGGFIAGNANLIEALTTAPAMLLTVGFPPTAAAAALTALEVLESEPDRVQRLWRNTAMFTTALQDLGVDLGLSQNTPICPVMVPSVARVVFASSLLLQRGIYVGPVTAPAVAPGQERLRFFITSEHTEDQLKTTAGQVAEVIEIAGKLDDTIPV